MSASGDKTASTLWLSHVTPQYSEQLWSQATSPPSSQSAPTISHKDAQELATALSAFQAAVIPTESRTVKEPQLAAPTPAQQASAAVVPAFPAMAMPGLATGMSFVPMPLPMPPNAQQAVPNTQPQFFMQLLGYLPDGRPMFVPAALPTLQPLTATTQPQAAPSLPTPQAATAVNVSTTLPNTPGPEHTPTATVVSSPPKVDAKPATVAVTQLNRPFTSSVTIIGAPPPAQPATPLSQPPSASPAVKGARPAPLSVVPTASSSQTTPAPATAAPAATTPAPLSVRVGVTAVETAQTPISVVVGQTPTNAKAATQTTAASPSVTVGQRATTATTSTVAQQPLSVRVGVTPSPASTPISVRVGVPATGNLTSAVASMPLSLKPEAAGSGEGSELSSPTAGVADPAVVGGVSNSGSPVVVNSLLGSRPPALTASSPTGAIVQRAVMEGMTPTANSTRRGRSSQLPTPLGALQSPSVRVGMVPLTSVTVGARPTPTAAMSVTVAGITVPPLAAPVSATPTAAGGGLQSLLAAKVSQPPRLLQEGTESTTAVETDAWARFAAHATESSTVHSPLLSVAVPVTIKQPGGNDAQHRRREGPVALSPHRSVSEVAPRHPTDPSPHRDQGGSRSSSTTASTVSSLPWKPAYKTRLCRTWMSAASSCKYGSKCMFAHGDSELVVVREAAQVAPAAGRDIGSRGSSQSDSSSRRYVGVQAQHIDAHAR